MKTEIAVVAAVREVYVHIDKVVASWGSPAAGLCCAACGDCCDFETYDHRLFVTSPEVSYLAAELARSGLKTMQSSRCPYNVEGKCAVHQHRFAGCRIFFCRGDADKQAELSQWASVQFKNICHVNNIPYTYTDLRSALNRPA